MRILLFDIDGTLIRSGGAGKAAMEAALQAAFGVREIRDRVSYSGHTDPSIMHALLVTHDLEPHAENMNRLQAEYLLQLPRCLHTRPGLVLPGIPEVLKRAQGKCQLGLLTGNIRAGAEIKLRHFGLWEHFAFGGFADGIPERDDVARHALMETTKFMGSEIHPKAVWVIGDTPLDVKCARAIGAHAVAVKTGWHTPYELAEAKPDWLIADFTQAHELLAEWSI